MALLVGGVVVLTGDDGAGGGRTLRLANGIQLPVEEGPGRAPKELWTERVDCSSRCSIVAGLGGVFVLGTNDEGETELSAFDPKSGEERWSEPLDSEGSAGIRDGQLLVSTYNEGEPKTTSFDPSTGDRRWSIDGASTQFVVDGTVLVSTNKSDKVGVKAVRLSDGDELWSEDGGVRGVCNGNVYVVDGDDLLALNIGTGESKWSESMPNTSVACNDRGVFSTDKESVVSLDPSSGDERWKSPVSDLANISVVEDLVLASGRDMVALNAGDGKEAWNVDPDDWEGSGMLLIPVGSGLALGGSGEDTTLINLKTGDIEDRLGGVEELDTQRLYAIDGDEIEAYDIRTFKRIWKADGEDDELDVAIGDGRIFLLLSDELKAFG